MLKKKQTKNVFKNVKYEDLEISGKKRTFSKIEVDPYALEEEVDERPLLLKLKEYFYEVWKEYFVIKWQKLPDAVKDFKLICYFIISLAVLFVIIDIIFLILRTKGVL